MSWPLSDAGAPAGLVEWAATQPSLEAALATCPRADWLAWLLAANATNAAGMGRAIDVAVTVVTLSGRSGIDAAIGALVAATIATLVAIFRNRFAYHTPARVLGAAVGFCVLFPLAARLVRRIRMARVRRRFARARFDDTWRALAPELAAAWERATPGRRAALMLIAKKSM
jgi:hypothetical protein